ncbi:SpoIID/LytB domain-containing protein [Chryseomicrobium palamuruense]
MVKKLILPLLTIFLFFGGMSIVASAAEPNFPITIKLSQQTGPSTTYKITLNGDYTLKEDNKIVLQKNVEYTLTVVSNTVTLSNSTGVVKDKLTSVTFEPKTMTTDHFVFLKHPTQKHKVPHTGQVAFKLETSASKLQLQPYSTLPVEEYLKGVVPGEMPASWGSPTNGGMEALKAQAVIARSYAYVQSTRGTKSITDTTTHQVYKGFIWESKVGTGYNVNFQYSNKAVMDTQGQVVTQNGKVISTYFSASNGGRTELPQQYWTSSLPYIQTSKEDPYDTYKWTQDIRFPKKQLPEVDLSRPELWWNNVNETNLGFTGSYSRSATGFTRLKSRILSDLKAERVNSQLRYPDLQSIKITSINSMGKKDFSNTGKVENFSMSIDYYAQFNRNGEVSYSMGIGSTSQTLVGDTRYETAIEVAKEAFDQKPQAIVLGRGDDPVDALAGSVLAHKVNGPLLLTRSGTLPASVKEYIKNGTATNVKVYLLGGTAAINQTVERELNTLGISNSNITRVSGTSRSGTARAIAEVVKPTSKEVFIATGDSNSSDALSIGAYAAKNQMPILIQHGKNLNVDIETYIRQNGVTKVHVIGGTTAVSEAAVEQLQARIPSVAVERTSGPNRVETSLAIASKYKMGTQSVVIGNASSFIDALSGAVLAARNDASILLISPRVDQIPTNYFNSIPEPTSIYYLGGESVISKDLRYALSQYIGGILEAQTTTLNLTGKQLRDLMGSTVLQSIDFDLNTTKYPNEFAWIGTGFGHGIGLSQHGAYGMATFKDKKFYVEDILKFYYDGITIGNTSTY